jgi:cytochrome c nitrite reductase small subunit
MKFGSKIRFWLIPIAVLVGLLAGLGCYTFYYAEGYSYLSNNPKVCVNCHIMRDEYDGWQKASHHAAAVCVDCHVPHAFIGKWYTKAENGYRHSKAFTLQDFHEPIEMRQTSREVLNENCRRCHGEFVSMTRITAQHNDAARDCTHCHNAVGHGPRN